MICANCHKQIDENSTVCSECGVTLKVARPEVQNVVIEQPVVNQLIEEEHKDKKTKNTKKKILTVISVLFFALSIVTIIMANTLPEKEKNRIEVPVPSIKPQTPKELEETIKTINYNGFDVAYLSDYKAKIEEGLLTLEGNDLFFQLTIHPNVTKDQFEQNKNALKQTLTSSGYVINSEETTIRSGIEFYLIKMTNYIDNVEEHYEYYLATENNNLFEILVYELKDKNYAKISKQLRTIVKETKITN